MRILKYVVGLLVILASRGLAGRPDYTETSIGYKKYLQVNTGFANLKSLLRPAPPNIRIRRKLRNGRIQPRIETTFQDHAKYVSSHFGEN